MTSNQESQQPNSPRVDLFTEQVLFDTWQIGSHGDIARLSIQFFIRTAVIDIWHWGWSHEHDEWGPKRHLLHLDISAKRLPKLASALASATRFGLEQGVIPAGWAVGTEFAKESTEAQHPTDTQVQTP